jgi:membrane associated rhomboid family serine protease
VSNQRDLSVFYLVGGIVFVLLAVLTFAISPRRDSSVLLTSAGMALAGVLAIMAFLGIRRTRGR